MKNSSNPTPPASAELMAPAGGLEAGYAAFHYGANAIYLGLRKFSARADAENFSIEEADTIAAYAHSLTPRRRVYAAVNTLVLQDELRDVVELLGSLADIGVDALIVQDLGLYRIVRRHFPELPLHASTQMAVHNRAGVEALKELGFKRATLARELTIEEVRDIAAVRGIETEVFVHGALCYSYSGLCLFSSLTLGRSGNRGRCAYLCRDNYKTGSARNGRPTAADGGFLYSMKDLALPEVVPALCEAGVTSFKIEGRKKSPLYVAATVNYYRKLMDGTLAPGEKPALEADIQSIFSRPWTPLYATNRREPDVVDTATIGHRGTPAGQVAGVIRLYSGADRLRFTTTRAIELHDGLQIEIPGQPRPFGFAVDNLHIAKHRLAESVFEAPAGADVEVALPADHPLIPVGAAIYCSSSQDAKRRYRYDKPKPGLFRSRHSADFEITLAADRLAVTARVAPGVEARAELAGPFSPAKDPAKMDAAVRGAFEKLGDTRFALGKIEFPNPDRLFAPVSQLNQVRREVCARLEGALAESLAARVKEVQGALRAPKLETGNSKLGWSIKVDRAEYLDEFTSEDWENLDEVVVNVGSVSLDALAERAGRDRIRIALPLITRGWEEKELQERIAALQEQGWSKWEAANLSAWPFLGSSIRNPQSEISNLTTDWSLYVTNRAAALQMLELGATRFTLSPEDGLGNMKPLLAEFGPQATVIVYQDTPLFISEACVHAGAASCPGPANCAFEKTEMTSSHGDQVIAINRDCRTIVIGKKPLCLAPRIGDLVSAGAASLRADFVWRPYTATEVRDTWRALRSGKNLPDGHLGNFERGLE